MQGTESWTYNGTIFIPKAARAGMVEWFHENLQHTGAERTAKLMRQHFDWPGSVEHIKRYVKNAQSVKN